MPESVLITYENLVGLNGGLPQEMIHRAMHAAGMKLKKKQTQFSGQHFDQPEIWKMDKSIAFDKQAIEFLKPHINCCYLFEGYASANFSAEIEGKAICLLRLVNWVDYEYEPQ